MFYFDADNGYDAWSLANSRETFTDQPGEDTQETLAFSGSGEWLLGSGHRLQAVASHIDTELGQRYDADWVSDALCETFTCSGGNDTAQEIFARDRGRSIADLRLLGGDESLDAGNGRYVLGLYANISDEALDYDYPSVWYGDFGTDSDYDTERYALYGEYEFALTQQLSLTAGVRFEEFADDYSDSNGFSSDSSESLWNAELSLRYDLGEQTMLYATAARGAKPGGVNTTAGANRPFMSPPFQDYMADKLAFEDETLVNTEVGVKTRQLDGRLSASFALFHTQRNNAQLENWMWDGDAGLWVGYLDSSSDATSYGVELETRFLVNERVELFANIGWLETEVDSVETFDLDDNAFVTRDNRDQAKSPRYQYNLGTAVSLTPSLSARLEVEGQDDSYFGYYHNGQLDGYDLLNASLNWAVGSVSLTLWGRNLTDEDYAVHGLYFGVDPRDDFGAWSNQTYTQLGEPRTYGVEVSYDF
ncbi:MAG: TonB-dependent receptor [Halioglobus sp.]|nr:TonB-dependent receptor [Halioglobus sp.]